MNLLRVRKVGRRHLAVLWAPLLAAVFQSLVPDASLAQSEPEITPELLRSVMPSASHFGAKDGTPPVFPAYSVEPSTGEERLVGYAFLTADFPPEIKGYDGPIRVLVGMDLAGKLTGARVLSYRESLQSSRGDFLRIAGFQEQFASKGVGEQFRVWRDVDGITGATITVSAMTTGVRNAARRVATAYLTGARAAVPASPLHAGTVGLRELRSLSWGEMLERELATRVIHLDRGLARLEVSLMYLRDPSVGEVILGAGPYVEARARAGSRADGEHVMMIGVESAGVDVLRPQTLFFVQDTDTAWIEPGDIFMVGGAAGGKVEGQFRQAGLLLVEAALDMTRPFTVVLEPGRAFPAIGGRYPFLGTFSADYSVGLSAEGFFEPEDNPVQVSGAVPEPLDVEAAAATDLGAPNGESVQGEVVPSDLSPAAAAALFAYDEADETVLGRLLETTSWRRVTLLLLLLGLAMTAFLSKSTSLRWATLVVSAVYLGFMDGGFLSVSHIISGISVGPGVYLADLPLLIIVGFTIVSTLLWGRVFCGFVCPFGALQDLLERVVPRRFHRRLPPAIHDRALWLKYGILLLIVGPVLFGIHTGLFPYFEPFGTVFFFSRSAVLWGIAISILAVCVVVPRFYCRYACPLGAALAIASLPAPFRIRRVEQCGVCKVCENRCPTGAIRGPDIDFKECVRCNVCEVNLITRVGVCKHDMEEVRPRLVALQMTRVGSGGR